MGTAGVGVPDQPVRVAIVDDHPIWAETVGRIVEHSGAGQVVAAVSTAAEALAVLPGVAPNVTVMDLELPDGSGIEITRELVRTLPGTRVLVLSASDDRAHVLEALEAGASGYLVKTAGVEDVADAVRRVACGEVVLPSGLSDVVLGEFRRLRDAGPGEGDETLAVKERIGTFLHEGDIWIVGFGQDLAHVKALRGLDHIAALLTAPGQEVHALELASRAAAEPAPSATRSAAASAVRSSGGVSRLGSAGAVLDTEAKRAYRQRLRDLDEELEEAASYGDDERRVRAQVERDALIEQLAGAVGIGGRDRRAADNSDRARTAVGRAIRRAIQRIDEVEPEVADHLNRCITTGTYCRYDPERPIRWRLVR